MHLKVKMNPKELKKSSKKTGNCNLGPDAQALLDYAYGVHDKKKEVEWVPPPPSRKGV